MQDTTLHPPSPADPAPPPARPDHDARERKQGHTGQGPPRRGLEQVSSRFADEVAEQEVSLEEHRASEHQEGKRRRGPQLEPPAAITVTVLKPGVARPAQPPPPIVERTLLRPAHPRSGSRSPQGSGSGHQLPYPRREPRQTASLRSPPPRASRSNDPVHRPHITSSPASHNRVGSHLWPSTSSYRTRSRSRRIRIEATR
jgi:hypothetical protein